MASTQFDLSHIQWLLLDVEGTTTSVAFVYDILFPYARKHLAGFCQANAREATVQQCLERVQRDNPGSADNPIDILQRWMLEDRKHPALKSLQGLLWEAGYRQGRLKGHVYPDVQPAFQRWTAAGKQIGIYSSGSVLAQHLLFEYSIDGNLRPYLSAHFDTSVGHKQEVSAYTTIANTLGLQSGNILFISDIAGELLAAQQAGLEVCHIHRSDHPNFEPSTFRNIEDFTPL